MQAQTAWPWSPHTHSTQHQTLSTALRSLPCLLLHTPSSSRPFLRHLRLPSITSAVPSGRIVPLRFGSFGKAKTVRFSFLLHHTHARSCLTSQTPPAHPHAAGFCFRLATDAADHQHPRSKRQRHACSQPAAPSMTAHGVPCPSHPSLLHPGTGRPGSQPPTWSLGQMNELTVVTHIIIRRERWWSEPLRRIHG